MPRVADYILDLPERKKEKEMGEQEIEKGNVRKVLTHTIQPVGVVHSCFTEKFGIPRQPGLVTSGAGEIELLPEFSRDELLKEIDGFSHIWISFLFHQALEDGWRPTVRPPWLGGQKRVGVFASRSPHRPNFMGLSVVRLEAIEKRDKTIFLKISGGDMLDGTPVLDIRPYLPYSDRINDATNGYADYDFQQNRVVFSAQAGAFCREYEDKTGRDLRKLIAEVVAQDPRPASQRKVAREFGVMLWDVNCRFVFMEDDLIEITSCELVS